MHIIRSKSTVTDLGGLFQVAGVVLLDVVPGADGGFQLVPHYHPWALCWGAPCEEHHTGPCVGECALAMGNKALVNGVIIQLISWRRITSLYLELFKILQ